MDTKLVLLLVISNAYLLCFSLHVVHATNGSTVLSCSQTPYPGVCEHFTKTSLFSNLDQTKFSLRDLALEVTMEQAINAHGLVSSMNTSLFEDTRAKMAWNDCMELYKDTVYQLNRSMSPNNNALDTNTWLSAAITNHQTCQNGFLEFELSSHLDSFPPMLSNFSKMLSNSLAIHSAASTSSSSAFFKNQLRGRRLLSNGFPRWVSAADRKLLQSVGGPNADIVVAQDGSGNYKTITEAVAAASEQSGGNKRTVIHVKAGVYEENVEIKRRAKNLMFIGDGIDATIVTSSRNNRGGSTTFRSATFGK